MDHVILNNGIKMPLVGLGTWDLRGDECIGSVKDAIDLGYRLIDTAQMYENEKEVGIGIRNSGISRDQLFLTTKIYRISNSYEKAKSAIDRSLKALGTDYVDLLLLHEPYMQGPEMYRALEEAYRDGKARAIGISNYDERWLAEFLTNVEITPRVNQLEAHVFYQKWDFQALMRVKGILLQAWSPLARGIGKVTELPELVEIGNKYNKTAAQVALRFLVQRGISVIPKSKHLSRLKENLDILDFTLSEDDMNTIRKLDRNDTLFPWTKAF